MRIIKKYKNKKLYKDFYNIFNRYIIDIKNNLYYFLNDKEL